MPRYPTHVRDLIQKATIDAHMPSGLLTTLPLPSDAENFMAVLADLDNADLDCLIDWLHGQKARTQPPNHRPTRPSS